MVKSLEEIQQENRKLILETIHGCSYEEALEKDFLEATSQFTLFTGYKGDFDDVKTWLKNTGKPITLSRVLLAITKTPWIAYDMYCDDNDGMEFCFFLRENQEKKEISWELTKETLEEQSENIQRDINEMIKQK